jgi:hypothetical protein
MPVIAPRTTKTTSKPVAWNSIISPIVGCSEKGDFFAGTCVVATVACASPVWAAATPSALARIRTFDCKEFMVGCFPLMKFSETKR